MGLGFASIELKVFWNKCSATNRLIIYLGLRMPYYDKLRVSSTKLWIGWADGLVCGFYLPIDAEFTFVIHKSLTW